MEQHIPDFFNAKQRVYTFRKRCLENLDIELKDEAIKNLMSSVSCSIDRAMDMLKTPPEERQFYRDLLSKNA